MDLLMPVMDGVEATRRIMAESPCAIVVVTMDLGRNANRCSMPWGTVRSML
jgi:two-component system response regulator WspF